MKRKLTFKDYLLLSLAVHVVGTFGFYLSSYLQNNMTKKSDSVEVTVLTPEQVEMMKAQQIVEREKKNGRIVETQNANNQKPADTDLLSEKNNVVNKQSIAKLGEKFKNVKNNGAKNPALPSQQPSQPVEKKQAKSKLFNNEFDPYAALSKKAMEKELKAAAKEQQQQAEAGDSSTATDRVEGVQSELITALNTREYKYYGFFHRIKLQLNQWWQPKVREKITKLMKQGRNLASSTNRVTRVMIVLNDSGTLVRVQVLDASGVRDLDDAAVEAFRSAAPFPNPPKGIIDRDGTVKIPWDFVIES